MQYACTTNVLHVIYVRATTAISKGPGFDRGSPEGHVRAQGHHRTASHHFGRASTTG